MRARARARGEGEGEGSDRGHRMHATILLGRSCRRPSHRMHGGFGHAHARYWVRLTHRARTCSVGVWVWVRGRGRG